MENKALSLKNFSLLTLGFFILLFVVFRDVFLDSSLMLIAQDQLASLGARYIPRNGFFMPQWDISKLAGMPTIDATWGDAYHPLVFLQSIMDPARAVSFKFILSILFAFMSGLVLFTHITRNYLSGGLLSLAYALNPQFFTHIYGGHDGKMMVMSAVPLALYGIFIISEKRNLWGILIFALSTTYMLLSAHIQMVYFFLWGVLLISLFQCFILSAHLPLKEKLLRQGLIGIAVAITLMLSAVQIIPPMEYTSTQSVRGEGEKTTYGHAVSWSLHQEELMSILLPGFSGTDEKGRAYWGRNVFKLNHDTAGMFVLLLAFASLLSQHNRKQNLFWLFLISLSLCYAVGAHTPFFQIFYSVLPGVSKFRAPAMVIFWIPVALSIMAALLFREWHQKSENVRINSAVFSWIAILVLGVILRFVWGSLVNTIFAPVLIAVLIFVSNGALWWQHNKISFAPDKIFSGIIKGMKGVPLYQTIGINIPWVILLFIAFSGNTEIKNPETASYFNDLNFTLMNQTATQVVKSLIIGLLCAGGVWYLFNNAGKLITGIAIAAILIIIDTMSVNSGFIQTAKISEFLQKKNPYADWIKEQHKADPLNDYRVLTTPQTLNNNSMPLYNLRNADGSHDNEPASYRNFRGGKQNENLFYKLALGEKDTNPFLNLLNVRYLFYRSERGLGMTLNDSAMARTTLYSDWEVLEDEKVVAALKNGFDYRAKIILNSKPAIPASGRTDQNGTSRIIAATNTELNISATTLQPAILLYSGNWTPGWKATVNGEPAQVLKAFSTLRAVEIPSGESNIRFYYQSDAIEKSKWLVYIGILSLLIVIILAVRFQYKKS